MSADGRLAVVKRSGPGPGAIRLRHEAEMLRRAAHPGVVELIDEQSGDEGTTLTTAFVGGGTLREHLGDRCDLRLAARVSAVVAATLADLHDRGIAHGRVSADHILMGAGGRAVVCGWAEATVATEPGAGAPQAHADVAALGTLLRELAEGRTTAEADALRRVGDRALAADPAARPSMRSLMTALRTLVPEGTASDRPAPVTAARTGPRVLAPRLATRPAGHRARTRPGAAGLLAVGALVGVAVAVVSLAGGGSADPPVDHAAVAGTPAERPPGPSASPSVAPTSTSTTLPTGQVWPPVAGEDDACPPVPAPVAVDVDGDGCEEAVEVAAGLVSTAGARWQVGAATDVVVVGDWDCDGSATPAVVRPGTGVVWLFPRWAGPGEDVPAELAAVVPEAVSATTVERPPTAPATTCARIEVVDQAGNPTMVSQ